MNIVLHVFDHLSFNHLCHPDPLQHHQQKFGHFLRLSDSFHVCKNSQLSGEFTCHRDLAMLQFYGSDNTADHFENVGSDSY